MINYSNPPSKMLFDFEAFSPETIDLSPESVDQAVEISANVPNEQQQWRTYLNVLALSAFEQWLDFRAPELTINRESCTILKPEIANTIDTVCNLQVDQFKLCLIATGNLTDEEVTVPRGVVDLPEFIPHFYVIVEVQEEQETAVIQGFLSYQELEQRQKTVELTADEDWTYQLPLTWFEANPDLLLLFLRCLEPTAIYLPVANNNRVRQLAEIRSELIAKLPQLQTPNRQLWQILSWEQGAVLLTNPELLHWVYQLQCGEISLAGNQTTLQQNLSDILQLLTQPAVNVGRWLLNERDKLAEELSWVLLPSIALASPMREMRSPLQEFEGIAKQLRHNGVEIPTQSRGAYQDLTLAGIPLRLYGVTWLILPESTREWALLLVLGVLPGTSLPSGLRLRVSDESNILVEQELEEQNGESYVFTSVIGTWDEKFIVTVGFGVGIEQTLPPFRFDPQ